MSVSLLRLAIRQSVELPLLALSALSSDSTEPAKKFTSIGGQAVLEGVMMRSPKYIAVAVRKPTGAIVIHHKPFRGITEKFPFFKKPILRGVVTLIESMVQGMKALSFSANVTAQEGEAEEELSSWAIAGSMFVAFFLGMGLFVALPHLLTVWLGKGADLGLSPDGPLFHLLDGIFKMAILLAYVYLIGLMKDIHRVFQYHGAEHKTIYAFEKSLDLTVDNARIQTTLHPRCGTSFLLFLVLISILVFSGVFPIIGVTRLSETAWINHVAMILLKIVLMLPVAGIAYEFIRACACRMESPLFKALIWPGLMLQKFTTREPDDSQLEVALASMRQVLKLEKSASPLQKEEEFEIKNFLDILPVAAHVAEFPEA